MASIINNNILLLNKLIDLIDNKRNSIFKLIDEKRGNVSKEQIKIYINEMAVIIENEKINQEKSQQIANNSSNILPQMTESEDNIETNVIDVPTIDGQNTGSIDNYTNLKTEDKLDIIFHKVLDLTSKVETNRKLINQKFNQTNSSRQQRQRYSEPQLKKNNDKPLKIFNNSFKKPKPFKHQNFRNDRNFYPIYEKYDNILRQQLKQSNNFPTNVFWPQIQTNEYPIQTTQTFASQVRPNYQWNNNRSESFYNQNINSELNSNNNHFLGLSQIIQKKT